MLLSLSLLLLTACSCLADGIHSDDGVDLSEPRFPPFRFRRMIGASRAPLVPWQAMVYLSDNILTGGYAGGALISDRWVLTAGRNLFAIKYRQDSKKKKTPLVPKVFLGISKRTEAVSSREVAVEKVVLHPYFQNQTDWDNDLALIKLTEPVAISDKVTPIPLPERGQDLVDGGEGSGVITGWGWGTDQNLSQSLKHLIVPLVNHSACKGEYETNQFTPAVDGSMFCTKHTKWEENVCVGDAGGALAVRDAQTGDVYAAGILSYDAPCRIHKHAVYMKLSSYLPWIHAVTRGDVQDSKDVRTKVMAKMHN